MAEQRDAESAVRQVQELLDEISTSSPAMRETGEELIRLLMQLYGAGLSRVVEILRESNASDAIAKLAEDRLVGSLMLLHGLHPVPTESRVRKALHRLQKRLAGHRLVLGGVSDGVAQIVVQRDGASPFPSGLTDMVERGVLENAPELRAVEIEGLVEAPALVQIEMAPAH